MTDRPVPVQRYLCPQRPASRDRPQEGRDTEPPHVRIGRNFLAFSETSAPHAFKSENSKSREAERLAGAAGLGSRLGRGPISAGASALLSGRLSASARGRQGSLRPCLGRCERLGGHTAHASVGTRGSSPGVSPGRVCLPCLAGGPRESFAVCTPQRPAWGTLCPDCTCPLSGQDRPQGAAPPAQRQGPWVVLEQLGTRLLLPLLWEPRGHTLGRGEAPVALARDLCTQNNSPVSFTSSPFPKPTRLPGAVVAGGGRAL